MSEPLRALIARYCDGIDRTCCSGSQHLDVKIATICEARVGTRDSSWLRVFKRTAGHRCQCEPTRRWSIYSLSAGAASSEKTASVGNNDTIASEKSIFVLLCRLRMSAKAQ